MTYNLLYCIYGINQIGINMIYSVNYHALPYLSGYKTGVLSLQNDFK